MKITVLRKMPYENTFIYVMQFDKTFQYLFAWNNEIHEQRFEAKPDPLRFILWKTGAIDNLYLPEQLDSFEQTLLNGAMDSIDKIKKIGKYAINNKKECLSKKSQPEKTKENTKVHQAKSSPKSK